MSIYKKLFEAKKEIGKISKDSTNPFYKSKYFDINQLLEHVEPILAKHELLLLQPILTNAVVTQIYDIESGERVESGIELTNITDPQKRGSEITYYRRYTLVSLLGLQAEDDDANATVKKESKKPSENIIWLTDGQYKDALKLQDISDLKALIMEYDTPTKKMKKEYRAALIEYGKTLM